MTTRDELLMMKGAITELPEDQQTRIRVLANTLMGTVMAADFEDACIASGLFGLEFVLYTEGYNER